MEHSTDQIRPIATAAIHGLSFLNVYGMQRGIVHQRMRHTCAAQQRNLHAFRNEYNDERPQEALGQTTPASHHDASPRPYPSRLPVPEYPGHYLVKTVTTAGTFRFGKRLVYISPAVQAPVRA